MRRHLHWFCFGALLLAAAAGMSACGKKGPLYLPDDSKPARSAPSAK